MLKEKIWNIDRQGLVHRHPVTLAQFRAAQHRVQRTAIAAGGLGLLAGVVIGYILGVR